MKWIEQEMAKAVESECQQTAPLIEHLRSIPGPLNGAIYIEVDGRRWYSETSLYAARQTVDRLEAALKAARDEVQRLGQDVFKSQQRRARAAELRKRMLAKHSRVLAMHVPVPQFRTEEKDRGLCWGCAQPWPCPTRSALAGKTQR